MRRIFGTTGLFAAMVTGIVIVGSHAREEKFAAPATQHHAGIAGLKDALEDWALTW